MTNDEIPELMMQSDERIEEYVIRILTISDRKTPLNILVPGSCVNVEERIAVAVVSSAAFVLQT